MGDPLEMLWIGHAGILVRSGDAIVAVDPFLSGKFWWNGAQEVYGGDSPWIGSKTRSGNFLDRFAKEITAIAITHAHGDHFDVSAVCKLLTANPEIEVIAPRPVIEWIRASSILNPLVTRFWSPVERDSQFSIIGASGKLIVATLPNAGVLGGERCPDRVGYYVGTSGGRGVAHLGDTHGVGDWAAWKDHVTDLILWGVEERGEIVAYFAESGVFKKVWWIHWEKFEPGQFLCNQDVKEMVKESESRGISAGILPSTEWTRV